MRFYHVKPFDTVVFGENKSSAAGDDHEKGGKFPPEIMKLFNLGEKLTFFGIFPVNNKQIYMPMPADVLSRRKQETGPYYIPTLKDFSKFNGVKLEFEVDLFAGNENSNRFLPWVGKFEALERASGYISSHAFFKNYMVTPYGKLKIDEKDRGKELFKEEVRIGIALDYSIRTVKESMLYAHVHYRLKDGFVILVSDDLKDRLAYMGGERKVVRIYDWKYDNSFISAIEEDLQIEEGGLYKFYITTHAFLNKDIKPGDSIVIGDVGNGEERVEMQVEWIYSNGAEWISGVNSRSNYLDSDKNSNGKEYKGEENKRNKVNEEENEEITENNKNNILKKPAVLMLKPGAVFILRAKTGGVKLNKYVQIKDQPNLPAEKDRKKFIPRGWGSGIIWKINDEN